MIISDLGYFESTSDNVVGGRFTNKAFADAFAEAFGKKTKTGTFVSAITVAGEGSQSISSAFSKSGD